MRTVALEGFTLALPPGWSELIEDATYSDPDLLPPAAFGADDGPGTFYVAEVAWDPEATDQPPTDPADLEALAREWGTRRGIAAPLTCTSDRRPHGAVATASYRIADDFVAVWLLSNGHAVLCASYVCPWPDRDLEQAARDAIAASLRIT